MYARGLSSALHFQECAAKVDDHYSTAKNKPMSDLMEHLKHAETPVPIEFQEKTKKIPPTFPMER